MCCSHLELKPQLNANQDSILRAPPASTLISHPGNNYMH